MKHDTERDGPLAGLKVIDCATVFAGPLSAMVFADFGADVVKIEHPDGDALRKMGHAKDGHGLWCKVTGRNKRCITLDLHDDDGKAAFLALVKDADVLIENFRTGTLERWGLGWDVLSALNPRLVMLRVTGFGQTGPYRHRAGFGTIAEAFSGFAHITGEANGPPTLPPFGLADGVAAYHGAFAIMFAIYERDVQGSGKGQVIDLSLYEPLFALLGGQPSTYDQLGFIQGRTGNRSANNAPRNAYVTKDGRWVALSAAAPSITRRVLELTGGPGTADDPRFRTNADRVQHIDEVDGIVGGLDRAPYAGRGAATRSRRPKRRSGRSTTSPRSARTRSTSRAKASPRSTIPISARSGCRTCSRGCCARPAASAMPARAMGQHQREVLDELVESGALPADVAARLRAKVPGSGRRGLSAPVLRVRLLPVRIKPARMTARDGCR